MGSSRLLLLGEENARAEVPSASANRRIHTRTSGVGQGDGPTGRAVLPTTVDGPTTHQENPMSMLKSVLRTAVAAKVVQVISRELQKPENQRKLKEGISKLSQSRRR
jgi:hypothetical protein